MEISLSFGLSQRGHGVNVFLRKKTTLILMHHLATCQDIVSSFHQALRWETVSETVIQLHPPPQAYSTRKRCISSPNEPQQGSAINQQV